MEPGDGKPARTDDRTSVARLLSAGARRAERVAQRAGVDQAIDQAFEEALHRALRSPGIRRAVLRSLEAPDLIDELDPQDVALLVRRILDSKAAESAWAEVLESRHAQMLVERIAGAPEVRAAITSQGVGLIGDIGVRLTKHTESLDDRLERIVSRTPDAETNQAGLATRLTAAAVDVGLLAVLYSLASSVFASVLPYAFGGHLSLALAVALGVFGYLTGGALFVAFWVLAGQTPGMRFLSIRVVEPGARHLGLRCAVWRLFAVNLSLVPLGLGFAAILRNPRRRAWHDRLAGTEVIFDDVAQAAPHSGRTSTTGVSRAQDAPNGTTPL